MFFTLSRFSMPFFLCIFANNNYDRANSFVFRVIDYERRVNELLTNMSRITDWKR